MNPQAETIGKLLWTIVGVAFFALIVFLICREIVCWYWKINQIVKTLNTISETLLRHSRAWTDQIELMRQQQNRLAEMTQRLAPPVALSLKEPERF